MSSRPRPRRALRAALAVLLLGVGAVGAADPGMAEASASTGGQSNGIPAPSVPGVDPADLEFPGAGSAAVGGASSGGYLMASSEGKVYAFGGAPAGEPRDFRLTKPVVDIAGTPSGLGYWLVASDGGIFTFGDAGYFGSLGNLRLNKPIVGMAGTPTGRGYWLVAADGGIFSFGDATFLGSTGHLTLAQPIVGMAATASGNGYWMVASDGGIFSFGDAVFRGSTGNIKLSEPIVGMAATATGHGYWLGAADGGVFTFGDATFKGSMSSGLLNGRIVGLMPQGGDVRAPVLRHLTFGPTKIDTSNGPAAIKFRANITDDLSGHGADPGMGAWNRGETQVIFANPAGDLTHMGLNVFFRDADRIAGDRRDGIYRSFGMVPAHSPPGIWRLSSITMSDAVGNMVVIDGAVLAQAGFPTTFEQVGAGDADPPRATSVTVTPDRVDTSTAPAEVRISARIMDAGTGVRWVPAGFSLRNTILSGSMQRVSGDEHDGVWEGTVTVPKHARQGIWTGGLQLHDGAGNIGFFPDSGGISFTQVGPGDEAPPKVVSVTAGPSTIDTSNAPATVTVTVRATDDLAGLGTTAPAGFSYRVMFRSPSWQQVEGELRYVSGTDHDAAFVASLMVPRYSEQGTWTLAHIGISDRALNWNQEQFQNPATFEVLRTGTRP